MSRTLKTIQMTLDPRSVRYAIQQVEDARKQLREAIAELIAELATRGSEVAQAYVASFDAVDTGDLYGSIYGYYDPVSRIGYIIAGTDHAFYVEYGTGPVGADSPHPEAEKIGWEYDVGETIHEHPDPTYGRGWYYPGDDGKAHWTNGQPARPYMYNTFVWLQQAAEALGRNITIE